MRIVQISDKNAFPHYVEQYILYSKCKCFCRKTMFYIYRTRASNNRGYYYFFILSHVGFSLMFGGFSLKSLGY